MKSRSLFRVLLVVSLWFQAGHPRPLLAQGPAPAGPRMVVRHTLYDQIRMFFEKIPPLGFAAVAALLAIVVALIVMLRKR